MQWIQLDDSGRDSDLGKRLREPSRVWVNYRSLFDRASEINELDSISSLVGPASC